MPLKKRDGELILDWMEEIGFTWVAGDYQVCEETSDKNLNRFKLFQQSMMVLGISLWHGSSKFIPCDDLAFPSDDEFGWYRKDSNGKELLITISIYVGKTRGSSKIVKEFHTYIVDEMNVIPIEYRNYKHSFENLDDLHMLLQRINDSL